VRFSWLLAACAAILLALGLAGPIGRWLSPAAADSAAAREDAASLKARYAKDRERVLAGMRAALDKGDNDAAMSLGSAYCSLGDPELVGLHREATARQSARQNVEELARIVGAQCNEASARRLATEFLASFAKSAGPIVEGSLVRVADDNGRRLVLDRIASSVVPPDDKATDPVSAARREHRVRVHPDYAAGLADPATARGLVCVWRARTETPGKPVRSGELEFWLAPSIAARDLAFEPLAYVER